MRFDPVDGSKPTQSTVKTGTLATPPQQNPQREGFRFDGWTYDGQPFDFQTPILQDTTLKARWTKVTDWTLSPDHGPATGTHLTINPPKPQEPCYIGIQAAGNQVVGLTGDGRIYTWTQDSTPKQVSTPAQAPDGFHYLQATAGSRRQATLGSDQQIYTWNSGQSTPTILDTSQDAEFTSISMNGDRLLAVDRQGRIHAYQAGQNPSPVLKEQAATSLSGKAQAVTAVASDSRALIVDADGHAWTWGATNTEKAKPTGINLDAGIHIIQATALNQGVLLLDEDGQAYYLADRNPDITAVSLPESMKANRIAGNDSQAIITDTDGHVWAWKPGETPMRTDKGSQHYMQAIGIGDSITGIDRQGSIFTWTLDKQGQPGKPARITTIQAPTLESASMDSLPLRLSKKDDDWQTETPAHKPGPAIITIIGKHYGQPFTKSFNYMVERPLTRDAEQGPTYEVRFNTAKGSEAPDQQQVSYPYGRVQRPSPDPVREGYQFDGWFIGEVAYDFSKPVTEDLTLTAHWTPNEQNNLWRISPDKGSQLGNETTTITPPTTGQGIRFSQVSGSKDFNYGFSLAVGSDGNAYAWGYNNYGELGDGTDINKSTPVMVKIPDRKTYQDLPKDFTYLQVSAGEYHSVAIGSDGYVYAWGYNNYGQLGNNTTSRYTANTVPVRVRDPDSPNDTSKGLKATQVSAGRDYSLAVSSNGYTYAWGHNNYGQLGDNTTSDSAVPVPVRDPASPNDTSKGLKATQVSGGYNYSLALGSDGYAYAWGDNDHGQLGNKGTSDPYPYPVKVLASAQSTSTYGSWLHAAQISAGDHHSLAIGTDGNAKAWGYNGYGRLGDGTTTESNVPVPVAFKPQPVISSVTFDTIPAKDLAQIGNNSVTVVTPKHLPGTVKVTVKYTMGSKGNILIYDSLQYTYTPRGVLPQAGGEGILLALATGTVSMGGVLASRRHRREQHQLSHASLE